MTARGGSGLDYTLDLCDAIQRAGDAAEQDDADAFSYRDSNLRYALEREAFTRLVNDPQVRAAYARAPDSRPFAATRFDAAVIRELTGGLDGAGATPPWRRAARRAAGVAGNWLRRRHRASGVSDGRIWFVIDHAKFLTFLAPVFQALGEDRIGVISLVPAADEALASGDIPYVAWHGSNELLPADPASAGALLGDQLSILADYDRFATGLARLKPSAVVTVEGNAVHDELARRAAGALGVRTLCIQQGWSPVVHTGFRNMSYDAMAVWGEGFAELLQPHNPQQRFTVTGNPALQRTDKPEPPDGRAVGFFLQGTSQLISRAHLEAMRKLVGEVARAVPEATVFVREHPGAPLSPAERDELAAHANVVLAPAATHSLRAVLDACSIVVSIYSTTLLEAAALQIPPVVLAITAMERYQPDLAGEQAGIVCTTGPEAQDAIVRLLRASEPPADLAAGMARFRDRFFAGVPDDAAQRIAAVAAGETVSYVSAP